MTTPCPSCCPSSPPTPRPSCASSWIPCSLFRLTMQQGVQVVREEKAAFEALQGSFWSTVRLPTDALPMDEHPLVAHFVSLLVAFGHVKSTKSEDKSFLELFSGSEKWLRCLGAE